MKYVCQICGYIYDDTKEKVPFEQLPADWKCPLCGAAKTDFKPETADGEKEKPVTVPIEAELVNLSVGQLAALCSNLARGCEKQYKTEESKLFSELADYFTAAVPAVSDATVEKLAKNGNVEWYGIEFENGARARLCYTQSATIPMNVGVVGVIRYKGEMIEMFQLIERL